MTLSPRAWRRPAGWFLVRRQKQWDATPARWILDRCFPDGGHWSIPGDPEGEFLSDADLAEIGRRAPAPRFGRQLVLFDSRRG